MYFVAFLIASCRFHCFVSNIFRLFRAFSPIVLVSMRVQTPRLRSRKVIGQVLWHQCIRMHIGLQFAFSIPVFCALCESLVDLAAFSCLFRNLSILHAFSPFLSWPLTPARGLDHILLHSTTFITLHFFWRTISSLLLCQSAVPWSFSL